MQVAGRTREVPDPRLIGYVRADGRWTWRLRLWMAGLALLFLVWIGEVVAVVLRAYGVF